MIKKYFLGFIGFIGISLLLYIGFLYFTYLDEKITTGSGYGFQIGSTKKEVFDQILNMYENDIERYRIYKNQEYENEFLFSPQKKDFVNLENYNEWKFYFDKIHWDFIFFEFQNDKLILIHRHRQFYELP